MYLFWEQLRYLDLEKLVPKITRMLLEPEQVITTTIKRNNFPFRVTTPRKWSECSEDATSWRFHGESTRIGIRDPGRLQVTHQAMNSVSNDNFKRHVETCMYECTFFAFPLTVKRPCSPDCAYVLQ